MRAHTHAGHLPGWQEAALLNGLETTFWRLDTDEALRSNAVLVWMLDRTPAWDRLLHCFHQVTVALPRLRARVLDTPWRWGWVAWQEDPAFDVHHHLQRIRLPSPGGHRELLDLAERVGASPVDPARPPWRAVLVEELTEDRAALVIKVHHCVTDGGGLREAMDAVLPASRHTPMRPAGVPATPPYGNRPPRANTWAPRARTLLLGPRSLSQQSITTWTRAATALGRLGRHPSRLPDSLHTVIRELRRMEIPSPSPALAGRSPHRRFESVTMPLGPFKAAGRGLGASVTSTYIAVLLATYADYHRHVGSAQETLSMAVPVDLGRGGRHRGNNQVGTAFLAAPLAAANLRERIRAVHRLLQESRTSGMVRVLPAVAELLPLVPPVLLTAFVRRLSAGIDVVPSSMPGVQRPAYVAGAEITSCLAFGPRGNSGCISSLMSHHDTCTLNVHLDPAAVSDLPAFADLLHRNASDLLRLAAS
ncbi:wax ester/triacylglycerol synthase domain-containing protein [Streptomyces sp. NPDC047853]|uniref:wax ester/triacylglycerol synthase domain-containing protein n=1 Tax=unclassified Streptomyces TaxID=2593676 RepID=UPI0034544F01